ncbi:MAG: calcium-binding protein [Paracoccaceae bacterium]
MAATLNTLIAAIKADPGLKANNPLAQLTLGYTAATVMNNLILKVVGTTNVNLDGRLSEADMTTISAGTYANPADYVKFIEAHGNDNGDVTTGYHNVQNDGGTLIFQGRNFIDTVADAIYHFGFRVQNGRYFNEDGASNETTADVAGWLNYFLNGENIVYGAAGNDELGSGAYSEYFAAARNETFIAGTGNDSIWADVGNDLVYGGDGNDRSGGGTGSDRMYGDNGNDTLYGDEGYDALYGGAGVDMLGGGAQGDRLDGGAGADILYGGDSNDSLYGGTGIDELSGDAGVDWLEGGLDNDELSGGQGNDVLFGNEGNDSISGGEGSDYLRGGVGADDFQLWESTQASDRLYFVKGDSGKTFTTIDHVDGFRSGVDKIYLAGFGAMTFEALDYRGGGQASVFYDGRYLRVDGNGDAATDMIIAFNYVDTLRASDFVFL